MNTKVFSAFALLVLTLLSCGKKPVYEDVIPLVASVVADTADQRFNDIAAYDTLGRMGSIAVVGPVEETIELTEYLLSCDVYDNATGKTQADMLPDFAGETFDAVLDVLNLEYPQNELQVRDLAVRNALFAISSKSCLNPYDVQMTHQKNKSKIIVLSSSLVSGFGYEDIISLFRKFGQGVRLISPIHSMVQCLLSESESTSMVLGVWADNDIISSGVYTNVLHPMVTDEHVALSQYVNYAVNVYDTALSALVGFLDTYLSLGNTRPLDAILVDGTVSIPVDELNNALETVVNCAEDYMIKYNGILKPDFRFIDANTSIAKCCYKMMRDENNFTHRIAYPTVESYLIMPLVESSEQDLPFRFVNFNQRYLPISVRDFMSQNTLKMSEALL